MRRAGAVDLGGAADPADEVERGERGPAGPADRGGGEGPQGRSKYLLIIQPSSNQF